MTGPGPTHPGPSGPSQPAPPRGVAAGEVLDEADRILAGPLPRLGEVIRDAERYGAQMLAVLTRAYDPASTADPALEAGMSPTDFNLAVAVSAVRMALEVLSDLAGSGLPPVGSAVEFPARQDLEASGPASPVATPGGPDQAPGPSPRHPMTASDGISGARGAGPGYLGP